MSGSEKNGRRKKEEENGEGGREWGGADGEVLCTD